MTIVVGGEALIDLVPLGDGDLRAHPGGGPYNTARTLGRLAQDVCFLGCLSDDAFGAQLRAQLTEDGVRLDTVVPTQLPTTLALAELDAAGAATYRFYTEATSAAALEPDAALAALPDDADVLHIGTLGLVLEPVAQALLAVAEALAGRALVMLDPNCRPALIADRERYRRTLAAGLRHAHIVKASAEDLAFLVPGEQPAAAARALLDEGPALALVTLGGDGALIVTSSAVEPVPAPRVAVVDTIGAGDAFAGGFIAWWQINGLTSEAVTDLDAVRAATHFACTVAARTCERAGASPPQLSEL